MSGFSGCPGSRTVTFDDPQTTEGKEQARVSSHLRQWPIQLHLISPAAPYYREADVLLVADCVPFAMGNFHQDFLKGKALAIACPKLDEGQEVYVEKIRGWFDEAQIKSLTVLIMEVPCCRGLAQLAVQAWERSGRNVPIRSVTVSLKGDVIQEDWLRI